MILHMPSGDRWTLGKRVDPPGECLACGAHGPGGSTAAPATLVEIVDVTIERRGRTDTVTFCQRCIGAALAIHLGRSFVQSGGDVTELSFARLLDDAHERNASARASDDTTSTGDTS